MNRIQLFIEGKEIELDSNVSFAITKQFEDITNPTTIINDWSKTVEIPFTARNNKIFGHIYSPDKVIVDGENVEYRVGVFFNPYLKLDMKLVFDGMLIMTGYAKMSEVDCKDGKGTYKINLNGQLGKVFQEMKKLTFDESEYTDEEEKSKYYIDGSMFYDGFINQDVVANSWESTGQTTENVVDKYYYVYNPTTGKTKKLPNISYVATDYVGFAPCNAFDEDFDYKTFQLDSKSSKTFSTVIDEKYEAQHYDLGIEGDSLLPEGMLPREIGEYRSYLQLPYVYFNKLFGLFKKYSESVTGYKFNLDTDWFNVNNPYWHNIVFMLKKLESKSGDGYNNGYKYGSTDLISWKSNKYKSDYTTDMYFDIEPVEGLSTEYIERMNFDTGYMTVKTNDLDVCDGFSFNINIYGQIAQSITTVYWNIDNCLSVDVDFVDEDDNVIENRNIIIYREGATATDVVSAINNADYTYTIPQANSTTIVSGKPQGWKMLLNIANVGINKYLYGDNVKIKIHTHWINNLNPVGGGTASTTVSTEITSADESIKINDDYKRSNAYFKFNDMWDNEYNLFEQILNYCKMFRICINVDELNKEILFQPLTKFFSQYTIEDWTDKVNISKDYVVKPITFDKKYVLFNYEDSETKIGETYREKFGMNFGEKKIITEYKFNTDTSKLFDSSIQCPIVNTDNVLSWSNIYNGIIKYSFPAEKSVYCKDGDKKYVSNFGSMYFFSGRGTFSTEDELNLRDVYVSDDTQYQIGYELYCYTQDDTIMRRVLYYPILDVVYGENMCTYGIPAQGYTYNTNYSGKKPIFDNFWRNYTNERYNIQNKIVTCYVYLTPIDYSTFKFNKFIKIENQLYFVNKIYDYDMSSTEPTKVDLITIQSIEGYTVNNYTI